jgi:cysteinyl-tRNA synthetase
MAKSGENFLRLQTIEDKGFSPIHYRYFCLGAQYRSELRFTWENLEAAKRGFETLKNLVVGWKIESKKRGKKAVPAQDAELNAHREAFWAALTDDFNAPAVLGVVWELARDSKLAEDNRLKLMLEFDQVLGFGVADFRRPEIAPAAMERIRAREQARAAKDWKTSDAIRDELAAQGIQLMDTPDGTDWYQTVRTAQPES